LAWSDDGATVIIKNMRDLLFLDAGKGTIRQKLPLPPRGPKKEKPGFSVVGLLVEGNRVYASDAYDAVHVAERGSDGVWGWIEPLKLRPPADGGAAHPAGLARHGDDLWVAGVRCDAVQRINLKTRQVEEVIPVGVAPFMLCFRGDRCYVSNWGGDPPQKGEPQSMSTASPVRIDPRTRVANQGSVSVLTRVGGRWKAVKSISVGVHPSGLTARADGRFVYVANANSDTVSVIDPRSDQVVETISCRPAARLPFGSGANALTLSKDEGTLYVANGTNNCLAVVRLGSSERETQASRVVGLIPTGWYPSAVQRSPDGGRLAVANVKGHGSLSQPRPVEKGKNSHDHLGSVSLIPPPDDALLGRYTTQVNANNRLAQSLAGLEKPRLNLAPVPVPARHGEPSVFQHVIYIIKENRTYDQVFGDLKEGNGDPRLLLFGEEVTPNHHQLAREFTLFDNFYCSGVLSADGHSWTDAAYVTDYLEKQFGGFTLNYPDEGHDALAFSTTGFLWDNALGHGKTFRNYGEFVREAPYFPKGTTWTDLYRDYQSGAFRIPLTPRPTLKSLEPYTHPTYPYFPLHAPDVYRAALFLRDFRAFEQQGKLPNLIIMSLPCDHTVGTRPGFPTPRAMVADNDLALGRIIEAVSRSQFWKDTCIFVVEDDPQDGFDHVDGHRTVALVISPYTRRRFVDHTNYNQTGMVKTMELILGLSPMNQLDLSATPMRNCFQTESDLRPYTAVPNRIALDEMNPPLKRLTGKARYWAEQSLALDLDEGDKADEETLNRILWYATRGYETAYPGERGALAPW
jgi:YVTN family beta-propeller protein